MGLSESEKKVLEELERGLAPRMPLLRVNLRPAWSKSKLQVQTLLRRS